MRLTASAPSCSTSMAEDGALAASTVALSLIHIYDKELGLHLMSDTYIVNDLIEELRRKQ